MNERAYEVVIKPKSRWFDFNFREFFAYRDLLWMMVYRTFVTQHKQTILGPLWAVLQPLLTSVVFTVFFGMIAKLSTDGIPPFMFYMCGNILWGFFALNLTNVSNVFRANAQVLGKVYFPRLIMPVANVMNNFISFFIQAALFILIELYYVFILKIQLNLNPIWLLSIPLILLQVSLLSLGVGFIITSVTTKYRDLAMLVSFGVQLWMYASPLAYSTSIIGPQWISLYMLNPISPVIEIFRYAALGIGTPNITFWLISLGTTAVVFFIGLILFNRAEKSFVDTI